VRDPHRRTVAAGHRRNRDIVAAGQLRQPGPQVRPVNRRDLAALDIPGHEVSR
jgi:hypothetical protein